MPPNTPSGPQPNTVPGQYQSPTNPSVANPPATNPQGANPSATTSSSIPLAQWIMFFAIIIVFSIIGTLWVIHNSQTSNDPLSTNLTALAALIPIVIGIFQFPYFQPPFQAVMQLIEGILRGILQTHITIDWKITWAITSTIVAVLLVFTLIITHLPSPPTEDTQTISCSNGLSISSLKESDNDQEPIGISDGCFAFDTSRASKSNDLKNQAAEQFRGGHISEAKSLWKEQVAQDTNDAETYIYLQDLNVAKLSCETIIVVTTLTGDSSSVTVGRSDLQGAYIAQQEYNKQLSSQGACLRLLVANAGGKAVFAQTVAQQIVALAKNDHTILGVMGWPFSTASTIEAIAILAKAGISMVSPTASSNRLTGISPYFFRVAPTDGQQGTVGARFATQVLHAKRAVVFIDRINPYSQTLGDSFYNQFNDGYNFIIELPYTVGTLAENPGKIAPLLQKALSYNPDLIYFSGYANDFDGLRTLLLSQRPAVLVMGGDGLYELGGYTTGYKQIYLTAFAHPDIWSILNQDQSSQKPPFFDEFSSSFDPNGLHKNNPTNFRRPESDAILSYDATKALITAYQNIPDQNQTPTRERVQQALTQIDGSDITLQGASGQINFGPEGDPVNKTVNVLQVDNNGCSHIVEISGQFLVGGPTAPQQFPQGPSCPP